MPLYEYYCRSCGTTFELLRPMNRSSEPAACPAGHPGAERVVSLFAAPVREGDSAATGVASSGICAACSRGSCAGCGR